MNGFTNTSMPKLCMPAAKKAGGELHKHLRCQKKRRKRYGSNERRGKIANRVSIEQRPAIVDERKRLGDWEADTMIGKKSPYALVTLVERKSRLTLLKKIDQRTAAATKMAIIQMLTPYKTKTLTITCDNGKEFAAHQEFGGFCTSPQKGSIKKEGGGGGQFSKKDTSRTLVFISYYSPGPCDMPGTTVSDRCTITHSWNGSELLTDYQIAHRQYLIFIP